MAAVHGWESRNIEAIGGSQVEKRGYQFEALSGKSDSYGGEAIEYLYSAEYLEV